MTKGWKACSKLPWLIPVEAAGALGAVLWGPCLWKEAGARFSVGRAFVRAKQPLSC